MVKAKGGRGVKASYQTTVVRVPEDLKEYVNSLVTQYHRDFPEDLNKLPAPGPLTATVLMHLGDQVNPFYQAPETSLISLLNSGRLAFDPRANNLLTYFWLWYMDCLEALAVPVDPESRKVDTSELDRLLALAFGCNSNRLDELYRQHYGTERQFVV